MRDQSERPVVKATVSLMSSQRVALGSSTTDSNGNFQITDISPGDYFLYIGSSGFALREVAVSLPQPTELDVVLSIQPVIQQLTVTADPGQVERAETTSLQVNVIRQNQIWERVHAVTAQVANEEVGVSLQRTSPTIGGIYVRGLTGNKVNVFVDGVRFSTSAMRGGINTFLNTIDANTLDSIEILRGPTGAQYGSDAIGGSVQALTRAPMLSDSKPIFHGGMSLFGDTATASYGSAAWGSYATKRLGLVCTLGQRINTLAAPAGIDSLRVLPLLRSAFEHIRRRPYARNRIHSLWRDISHGTTPSIPITRLSPAIPAARLTAVSATISYLAATVT